MYLSGPNMLLSCTARWRIQRLFGQTFKQVLVANTLLSVTGHASVADRLPISLLTIITDKRIIVPAKLRPHPRVTLHGFQALRGRLLHFDIMIRSSVRVEALHVDRP